MCTKVGLVKKIYLRVRIEEKGMKATDMIKFAVSAFSESPGNVQYPTDIQTHALGIDTKTLKGLKGKRIFVPACGRDGALVEYLRENEVIAEGMDPTLKNENDYLIRRSITTRYEGYGTIPRPDDHYDGIYAHAFGHLFYPFSGLNFAGEMWGGSLEGGLILVELMRVLKIQGKLVSYPWIKTIPPGILGFGTPKYSIKQEVAFPDLEKVIGGYPAIFRSMPEIEKLKDSIKHRSIITKL